MVNPPRAEVREGGYGHAIHDIADAQRRRRPVAGPSLDGGALPGSGSYGDPIQGLGQSNAQMKGTLDAFTATLNATSTLNAGFEAGNAARNGEQRSQNEAGFEAAQSSRETMFAAPPVTGPMLPPNFAETARVPGQPAFDLNGPVPPPGAPDTGAAPETAPPATPAADASTAAGQAAAGMAAAPAIGLGWGAADGAADAAAAAGRTVGGLLLRGGSLAGAYFGLGTGSIPSQTAETAMQLGGTAFDPTPLAEQPGPLLPPSLPGGFATPPTTAPPPLTLTPPGADIAAKPLPGLTPAPPAPGLEGLTPIAPGGFGPLPGLVTAPPQGVTLPGLTPARETPPPPGFGAVDPGLIGPQISQSEGFLTGSLVGLTTAEVDFVNEQLNKGVDVRIIPRGLGRTADFELSGITTEYKHVSNIKKSNL